MPRALWSGSIAFGLVNAPVRLYSAIDEHDLDLHLVHVTDGSRIGADEIRQDRSTPQRLEQLRVDELGGRARKLAIEGRSKMSKRELVSALERAKR